MAVPKCMSHWASASFTVRERPSNSVPRNFLMVRDASCCVDILTKPKPLRRPVSRSVVIVAESSVVAKVDEKVLFADQSTKTALLVNLLEDKGVRRALVLTRTNIGSDTALCVDRNVSTQFRGSSRQRCHSELIKSTFLRKVSHAPAYIYDVRFTVDSDLPNLCDTMLGVRLWQPLHESPYLLPQDSTTCARKSSPLFSFVRHGIH